MQLFLLDDEKVMDNNDNNNFEPSGDFFSECESSFEGKQTNIINNNVLSDVKVRLHTELISF